MKKARYLLLFTILTVFLSATFVSAIWPFDSEGGSPAPAPTTPAKTTIFAAMKGIFTTVFTVRYDPNTGKLSDETSRLVMKILLAILLFALLFGVINKVLADFPSGSKIAISLSLAILSVVLMPDAFLVYVGQAYGFAFLGGTALVIIGGIAYLIFYVFEGETFPNYIAKSIASFIGFVCLGMLAQLPFEQYINQEWTDVLVPSTSLASMVFLAYGVYSLFWSIKAAWSPKAGQPSAFQRASDISNWASRFGQSVPEYNDLCTFLADFFTRLSSATNLAGVNTALSTRRKVTADINGLMAVLRRNLNKVEVGDRAAFNGHLVNIDTQRGALTTALTAVVAAATPPPFNPAAVTAAVNTAQTAANTLLTEAGQAVGFIRTTP